MAQTAEEVLARDVTQQAGTDLYGLHRMNTISGPMDWMELMNRHMILRVLEDEPVDDFLTDEEQALLEGLIIIKS